MPSTPRRKGRVAPMGAALPSEVLADNVRAYRALRQLIQEELAERMSELGHDWSRSTVGDVERNARGVTVDELFGLAISIGVTIGQLLDPTGPDHSRALSLDVGLYDLPDGTTQRVGPWLSHLWASSRAVAKLFHGRWMDIEFDVADDLPMAAQRELENLRSKAPFRPLSIQEGS